MCSHVHHMYYHIPHSTSLLAVACPAKIKQGGHFGVLAGMWVLHRATNCAKSQAKIRIVLHFVEHTYWFWLKKFVPTFIESEVKPKPIMTHSHMLSYTLCQLHFSLRAVIGWLYCVLCDWLTALSVSIVIGWLYCLCPLWLVYCVVCVLCDWFTVLSVSFVIGSLHCLCPLWLVHCIVCVLCDWLTVLSVSIVIGSLCCLCPLWSAHCIVCVLMWLVHCIVCVLCHWFTVLSVS